MSATIEGAESCENGNREDEGEDEED